MIEVGTCHLTAMLLGSTETAGVLNLKKYMESLENFERPVHRTQSSVVSKRSLKRLL